MSQEDAQTADAADRRVTDRRRTLKAAQVVYNGGQTVLNCTIKDLSDTGAKIELPELVELPETFFVYFADGRKTPVEVMWTAGNKRGVRFVEVAASSSVSVTSASVKNKLIGEIIEIEKQLANLRNEVMIHLRE